MSPLKRSSGLHLPLLELECLQALWALGQGTVQQLHARLLASRPLAYTTVMTVMDRLARKGVVAREKRGRAHLYRSLVAEEASQQDAVNQLVKDFFGGSREELLRYLEPGPPRLDKSHQVARQRVPASSSLSAPTVSQTTAERQVTEELDPELL